MKLYTPKYFTLEELLTSSIARQKSIENLPSWQIVENLLELAMMLDRIREAWGSGIRISSGFRNTALNTAVGGVKTSVHRLGFAADLIPVNGKFDEFVAFLKDFLKDKAFDQCIIENNKKSKWVHFGLWSPTHTQRRQCFNQAA